MSGAVMVEYKNRPWVARPAVRPLISAGPAQELLWSLIAGGHTQARLAGELGMSPGTFSVTLRQPRVTVATHQAMLGVYRRLRGQAPPEGTAREREAARRARRTAATRHDRPCRGAALIEEYEELASYGVSIIRAAQLLRVSSPNALAQAVSRFDRKLENIMAEMAPEKTLRGRFLLAEAEWLAEGGVNREEVCRRLGVPWKTIEQAVTWRNRKLAAAEAAAAVAPAAEVITLGWGRRGCGTILALLLHAELGEPACDRCQANADRRGYQVRGAVLGRRAA